MGFHRPFFIFIFFILNLTYKYDMAYIIHMAHEKKKNHKPQVSFRVDRETDKAVRKYASTNRRSITSVWLEIIESGYPRVLRNVSK